MNNYLFALCLLCAALCASCGSNEQQSSNSANEDTLAIAELQGIWLDAEEDDMAFRIKGDTIYYPDTISRAVRFAIMGDTLCMYGSNVSKYPLVKRSLTQLSFRNAGGDTVRFIKSDSPTDSIYFLRRPTVALNQSTLVKSDTIVSHNADKYHCYYQVNPTTYKVYKSTINDDGIEVESVFYDNIAHLSVYIGAKRLFSKDFSKNDFSTALPESIISQCILSAISLCKVTDSGLLHSALLAMPDSPSCFVADFMVSYSGELTFLGLHED